MKYPRPEIMDMLFECDTVLETAAAYYAMSRSQLHARVKDYVVNTGHRYSNEDFRMHFRMERATVEVKYIRHSVMTYLHHYKVK